MDYSLINIIPGARSIWRSLRLALLIVAIFSLGASWQLSHTTNCCWLIYTATASILINIFYIALIMYITRLSFRMNHTQFIYVLAYFMLITSSTPALLMLLCGLDYSLFDILSWYILQDINKLMLPIAAVVFLSVTYWLPVKEITKIQYRYKLYTSIKINSNGK